MLLQLSSIPGIDLSQPAPSQPIAEPIANGSVSSSVNIIFNVYFYISERESFFIHLQAAALAMSNPPAPSEPQQEALPSSMPVSEPLKATASISPAAEPTLTVSKHPDYAKYFKLKSYVHSFDSIILFLFPI